MIRYSISNPTLRLIGSAEIADRGVAAFSRQDWFETVVPAQERKLSCLATTNREMTGKVEGMEWSWQSVLDMDSTAIRVRRQQQQSSSLKKNILIQ